MEHRRYSSPPMHMESCASCRKKGGGPLFLVTPPLSSADAVAARDAATKRAAAKRVVEPPIMTCSSLLWCVISFVRERISSVSVQGKRALRAIHDESNRIHYTCVCEQEEHVCEILILTRSQRERQKREGRPKLPHRTKSVMPILVHANGLEQAQRPTADSYPRHQQRASTRLGHRQSSSSMPAIAPQSSPPLSFTSWSTTLPIILIPSPYPRMYSPLGHTYHSPEPPLVCH